MVRVLRSADIDVEGSYDEYPEYREVMEHLIKERRRMNPVKLEFSHKMSKKTVHSLCKEIQIEEKHVFLSGVPLDTSFVFAIQNYLREQKKEGFYQRRLPRMTNQLDNKKSIMPQIMEKEVLLVYPFESIKPFIKLLKEAANDDSVVSIKMTLYRLADKSQIIDALVDAAENGKEVIVLVELRARFDEESNIEYSRKLEVAGCRVIYGLKRYKVHSKICLLLRQIKKSEKK